MIHPALVDFAYQRSVVTSDLRHSIMIAEVGNQVQSDHLIGLTLGADLDAWPGSPGPNTLICLIDSWGAAQRMICIMYL